MTLKGNRGQQVNVVTRGGAGMAAQSNHWTYHPEPPSAGISTNLPFLRLFWVSLHGMVEIPVSWPNILVGQWNRVKPNTKWTAGALFKCQGSHYNSS